MTKHIKNVHPDHEIKRVQCVCAKMILSYALEQHHLVCKGITVLQCEKCKKLFSSAQSKSDHKKRNNCVFVEVYHPCPEDSSDEESINDGQQVDDGSVLNDVEQLITSALALSLGGNPVPPTTAGVYFAVCIVPDPTRFVFDDQVPPGKFIIGFGYSSFNMSLRVDAQVKETGDYKVLDCIETGQAQVLETAVKVYLKYSSIQKITGYFIDNKGGKNKRTEFFVANKEEYEAVFKYAQKYADDMDSSSKEDKVRKHQLQMEVQKTMQMQMQAEADKFKSIASILETARKIVRSNTKSLQ